MSKHSDQKQKKRWFAKHAKSSAMVISLGIHAILLVIAISFVAVTVITKDEQNFEYRKVERPKKPLKKLKVPVKVNKKKPKPKLRKRIVVKDVKRNIPEFKMPEISGVKGGLASMGDGGGIGSAIGFSLPEIDFFGAKAKGEKIVFVVHFGPATISDSKQGDDEKFTPFSRMTGLTIRNRLEDLINGLPEYALFNVIAYFAGDAWAINPEIMLATPANKQSVMDWMEPVNPLEGDYQYCFNIPKEPRSRITEGYNNYPNKRVENLPFYSTKWAYPYKVPSQTEAKYAPDAPNGFMHWGRGVAWAILEQKADTIFVLTTNYIDGWHEIERKNGQRETVSNNNPRKMAQSLEKMCRDTYGPDKDKWPTINIVVLSKAGRNPDGAYKVLNDEFGPIWKTFDSEGSVIEEIKDYMNEKEQELYYKYKSEYGE